MRGGHLITAADAARVAMPAFATLDEQAEAHRRSVLSEFAELAANDDTIWSVLADAILDVPAGTEPADNVIVALKAAATT